MRKTTAALTALALAMTAAGAAAQRAGRGMNGPGMGMTTGRPGRALQAMVARQLFRGITLTDSQRTQLQKLRTENRTEMQTLMRSARTDRQAMLEAWANGDTVGLNAARRKISGDRNREVALRGQLLRSARAALTPAQQKQFDTNRNRLEQRAASTMRMMGRWRMNMTRARMMRFMAPNRFRRPMRPPGENGFRRGRGFGPGANSAWSPGPRGGFGGRSQRGPGARGGRGSPLTSPAQPDTSAAPAHA